MTNYFQKLYKGSMKDFKALIKQDLQNNNKRFIVTANPEAFMLAKKNPDINELLLDENTTIVADGIGIVKGADIVGINVAERIPGIDIAEHLFSCGNELKKSIYLFGAKQEIIDALLELLAKRYKNLEVLGASNGYVEDRDAVFKEIKSLQPDIVLVALGMPAQERLIYKHLSDFNKGIFVGVGGSFDVLSNKKSRAPEFFIKHNIEWLYRITKEPKRLKRFYDNNIKFIFSVKSLKRKLKCKK